MVTGGPFNFRALGGLPVPGGRIVARSLFRGAGLLLVDEERFRVLESECGIRGVIDLRSEGEVSLDGRPALAPSQTLHPVPIESADLDLSGTPVEDLLPTTYAHLVDECAGELIEALHVLADALRTGGVLVACTAGKDRTGVFTAAVLGLLGADRRTIVSDYHRSDSAHPDIMRIYASSSSSAVPVKLLPPQVHRAPKRAMEALLDHVSRTYGGWRGWSAHHGVPEHLIGELRTLLVEAA